jgi:hypothetical protein
MGSQWIRTSRRRRRSIDDSIASNWKPASQSQTRHEAFSNHSGSLTCSTTRYLASGYWDEAMILGFLKGHWCHISSLSILNSSLSFYDIRWSSLHRRHCSSLSRSPFIIAVYTSGRIAEYGQTKHTLYFGTHPRSYAYVRDAISKLVSSGNSTSVPEERV